MSIIPECDSSFGGARTQVLESFTALWQSGEIPDLDEFLGVQFEVDPETLAGLLCIDLHQRWVRGQRPTGAQYIRRFPELRASTELLVDVLFAEYLERLDHGQSISIDLITIEFPESSAPMRRQISFHHMLADDFVTHPRHTTEVGLATSRQRPDDLLPERPLPEVPGYQIVEEIGSGGSGIVYRAVDQRLKRTVALKMLVSGVYSRPGHVQRFRSEAIAAARLQHPNIVQIFEIGQHSGLPFLALEYVDGKDLSFCCGQPQNAEWTARHVLQIARAVAYLHDNDVVHRDLKPKNILLSTGLPRVEGVDNGDAVIKLTDFGHAKVGFDDQDDSSSHDDQTRSGEILGTPTYMAPEQADGSAKTAGPPADVYSIGVILYELLTGRPPLVGSRAVETIQMVIEREPVPPTKLVKSIPADIETICLKCLEKSSTNRYTAHKLIDDLQAFLDGRPILARPVSTLARLHRWQRRHPVTASLSWTVFLLTLALCVLMVTSWFRINQQLEIAQAARAREQSARLEAMRALDFSPNGKWLATGTIDGGVRVWNTETGVIETVLKVGALSHVEFSPDGQFLATSSKKVVLWRTRDWRTQWELPTGSTRIASHRLRFSSDGRTLVVSDPDGTFRFLDTADGKEWLKLADESGTRITDFALSRDGRYLAAFRETAPHVAILKVDQRRHNVGAGIE